MKVEQRQWRKGQWTSSAGGLPDAQLVFVFGDTDLLKQTDWLQDLEKTYPQAQLFGCSTSGEIYETSIVDQAVCTFALHFDHTEVKSARTIVKSVEDSFDAGRRVAQELDPKDLAHVVVLSPGLNVNGCELVKGLTSVLPAGVAVTGGLAGDQVRFGETLVISNREVASNMLAVIGLYGKKIKIGYASLGGWDPFGPERVITKSKGHILYELDGKSALKLYKDYLGDRAKELPAATQYFPLSLRLHEDDPPIVRTILTIDEENQSMISAGDLPEGGFVRLMKTNFDRLIDGATGAAEKSASTPPQLALLISCVGRRMVLKGRAVEEIESARKVFGDSTTLMGFYSYGEISPFTPNAKCELHNQTMTITTFSEEA